jgi:DNA repair exonuclease SbcCD nuclease subunit
MGKVVIHCIPYIKDKDALNESMEKMAKAIAARKKRTHIIMTHIGLDEATNGPNEMKLKGYPAARLRKMGAQKIIAGHHHHPQRFKGALVVGSPLQHNMLDQGDKRGLLVYDTDTEETTRIWLRNSRFFVYNLSSREELVKFQRDADNSIFAGGYVRILLDSAVTSEHKIADIVASSAKMFKILPIKHIKSGLRNETISNKAMANIGNLGAVVHDYVEHIDSPLNHKRLISIGKKLLY